MSKEEKEKLVPNLRFKGFTDDWIQQLFADLLDKEEGIRRGPFGSALKKDYFVSDSNYVVYEQRNAIDDHYQTRYNISKEKFDELHRFVLQPDDFIMSGAGTIGRISRVPKEVKQGVFNQALIRMKLNYEVADPNFFIQWMRSDNLQRKLTQANPASAMANLVPMSELKEWKVIVPKKEEQVKLGIFISKIENIITLEQEKLAHYQAMKKALSTSIFPRNNESLPNLTFNGDSGWKQQKLENFLSIPDKIKVEVTDTDEILSVKLNTNGVVGGESRSTLKLGATTYYSRSSGQFIYGKQNFFNGAMAIVPESLDGKVSSGDIPSLNISGINPQFLYEYLSRPYYYKQTETMASGTGSKRIHEKTLLNFKIKVPNSNVQSNIEHLLASLSNLIDIQNNKVKKVEQAKAYLLNNLFPE